MTDNGSAVWLERRGEGDEMVNRTWWIVGGVGASFLGLILFGKLVALLILLAVIGAPIAGYLMLDPAQRRRLKRIRERRQFGR